MIISWFRKKRLSSAVIFDRQALDQKQTRKQAVVTNKIYFLQKAFFKINDPC